MLAAVCPKNLSNEIFPLKFPKSKLVFILINWLGIFHTRNSKFTKIHKLLIIKDIKYMIYCITNNFNGKFYIGRTLNGVTKRWYQHIKAAELGSRYPIHAAIRDHGLENFSFNVLDSSIMSLEESISRESYFINKTDAYTLGYNVRRKSCDFETIKTKISVLAKEQTCPSDSPVLKQIVDYYVAPYVLPARSPFRTPYPQPH